jgi:hypothetical protein
MSLSRTRVWERKIKSLIEKLMGNDQLRQNKCRQVITFDDLFM